MYTLALYVVPLLVVVQQRIEAVLLTFDVDTSGMMALAEDLFNALWPIFQYVVAIAIALGLIGMLLVAIGGAFKRGRA